MTRAIAAPLVLLALCTAAPAAARKGTASLRASLPDFSSLARKITPSVVAISAVMKAGSGGDAPRHRFFQRKGPTRGLGSGFVIDKQGHILTNNHVVANATTVTVTFFGDERDYPAEVIGTDEMTDLALIRVRNKKGLVPVQFGDSSKLRVGEWVIAVGNPFGLAATVTAGIVSGKGRRIGASRYDDFIQTDASINPGNSGGPLVDLDNRVVGVNTIIFSPSRNGGNVGIGFAIPSNLALRVVEDLKAHGSVTRGWLGVVIERVTKDMMGSLGLETPRGALVSEVAKATPARAAGIVSGDVILRWDGRRVKDSNALPLLVAETEPGKKVEVVLLREGGRKTVRVSVGLLDSTGETRTSVADTEKLGLVVSESSTGLVVSKVEAGGPAEAVGILTGDVVVRVGRREVGTVLEYRKAVESAEAGTTVLLRIRRGHRSLFFVVELP